MIVIMIFYILPSENQIKQTFFVLIQIDTRSKMLLRLANLVQTITVTDLPNPVWLN